jgi:outer membrane protein assembly factor BamB
MNMARQQQSRPARILLWMSLFLFVVFLGLIVYWKFFADPFRYASDADLLDELARAVLIDDKDGLDAKLWPQWRGPRRDGVTTAGDLLTKWPAKGPKPLWRIDGGDGYSSVTVAGNSAYSMIAVGEGQEAVVCWNIQNGKERWRRVYDPGSQVQYAGPRTTPTIEGTRLYTVSSTGLLMCLGTGDGEVIWQHDLPQELGAVIPRWGFAFSPLVQGDRVFAMPGGSQGRCLAAFAKDDGTLLWAAQDDPAGYSSAVAATVAGVRQIVFFTGRRLVAVTPEDGRLLWEYPWKTSFDVNAATPEVIRARVDDMEETYLFISSGYGRGCALVKILQRDGKFGAKAVYDNNELCCHFGSPVRHGEYIYGLDETRDLTCLSLRTGQAVWRQRGFQKGTLLRVDDRLIVLGESGKLALVEASPEGYRELAVARPLRNRCWTMPVLADGRLYLRDQRLVMCLDVRKP